MKPIANIFLIIPPSNKGLKKTLVKQNTQENEKAVNSSLQEDWNKPSDSQSVLLFSQSDQHIETVQW